MVSLSVFCYLQSYFERSIDVGLLISRRELQHFDTEQSLRRGPGFPYFTFSSPSFPTPRKDFENFQLAIPSRFVLGLRDVISVSKKLFHSFDSQPQFVA